MGSKATLLLSALLVTSTLVGCRPEPLAPVKAGPPPERASAGPVQEPEGFVGVVVARVSVDVVAQVAGVIASVEVRPGARVSRGAVLARLDVGPTRQDLDIALAKEQQAEAERGRSEVAHAQARDYLEREQHLTRFISQAEIANAQLSEKAAAAALDSARAAQSQAAAYLKQLQETMDAAVVRAPFDGVIAEKYFDPGGHVDKGTALFRLLSTDERRVRFALPEDRISSVSPGTPVYIRAADSPVTVRGTVDSLSPEVEAASRTVAVETRVSWEDHHQLPAGTVVRVFLEPTLMSASGRR